MAVQNTVRLEVITPSKLFYRGDVEMVIVTTVDGDEGFMAGHAWACKLLKVSELWIQEKGAAKDEWKVAAIAGGFIDVKESIVIYTDAVEWSEDIDMERVLSAKASAEDWIVQHEHEASEEELAQARLIVEKSETRAGVAEGGVRHKR